METAGQLHELAWVKGACRPALLWLAQFDPEAPISAVYDALEHGDVDWLRWLIHRSANTFTNDDSHDLYQAIYLLTDALDTEFATNMYRALDNGAEWDSWAAQVSVIATACRAAYVAMWEHAVKPAMRDRVLAFFAAIEWSS